MSAPDVLGCPRCKASVRKTTLRCPSCAAHLRLVTIPRPAGPAEQLMAFATLRDLEEFVEHLPNAEIDPDEVRPGGEPSDV